MMDIWWKAPYLQPFSDSLQHVGDDGVVPQIGEPHSRAFNIHWAGQKESRSCGGQKMFYMNQYIKPVSHLRKEWLTLERVEKFKCRHMGDCDWLFPHSPIVTSEELCVSRKRLRWCQTHGIHSIILTSSPFLTRLLISVSRSFLRRYRPRKPFSGSIWLAHKTHLK